MTRPEIFWVIKDDARWAVRSRLHGVVASFETRAEAKAYAKQVAKTEELSRIYVENEAHVVERELMSGWARATAPDRQ